MQQPDRSEKRNELIHMQGIGRIFVVGGQAVRAVDDVDLDIARGEYVSIMGPSGSGKSTLLNLIATLDRPTQGLYQFNGIDTAAGTDDDLAELRRSSIGFVFQSFHLIPRLSAAQNIELPLVLGSVAPALRRERVRNALASMEMTDRASHHPSELSGGQRQRVAIARAMVSEPELLLADEPTGNLDSVSGRQVVGLLEELHESRGTTVIVVTHDHELGRRASRRIRMVDGRIDADVRP
ncbi:MAG: putative ABC transport system ATP-binding protein [Gammaproteobacteria bacterium]|jgi:putative ABC transport system ATP-binding protein